MIVEKLVLTRYTDDIELRYSYKLTQGKLKEVQAYGIELDRVDYKDGKIINTVMDAVQVISPQKEKVKSLLQMLYKNQVSPLHLVDIIGEYVDNYVSDFDNIEALTV